MKKIFSNISSRILAFRTSTKIKLVVLLGLLIWFWFSLPSKLFHAPTCYVIEDRDGNLLNATIAADGQWRSPYNKNVQQKLMDLLETKVKIKKTTADKGEIVIPFYSVSDLNRLLDIIEKD